MCLLLWAEMEQVYGWLWLPYFLSFSDLGSACDFCRVLSWLRSSEIERNVGGVRCAHGRSYGSFVVDLEGVCEWSWSSSSCIIFRIASSSPNSCLQFIG
jgi:hypothetical protein